MRLKICSGTRDSMESVRSRIPAWVPEEPGILEMGGCWWGSGRETGGSAWRAGVSEGGLSLLKVKETRGDVIARSGSIACFQ